MATNEASGINPDVLKSRTGEFDIESIHHLDLSAMGLQDLGCIKDCSGLIHLNLSKNRITNLKKLGDLKLLETLNISCNRISSLGGMEGLENLCTLNLSGNMIMSVDTLACLSKLEKLTSLRLQDKVNRLSNPVCQSQGNYKEVVCGVLPQLTTLDGERVSGQGNELFKMCDELETLLKEHDSCGGGIAVKSTPWPPGSVLKPSTFFTSDAFSSPRKSLDRSLEEAEKGFEDVIMQCKKINNEADTAISNAKQALWSNT